MFADLSSRPGWFFITLLVAMLTGFAAQAQEELPAFKILSCREHCGSMTAAQLVQSPTTTYPTRDIGRMDTYVEAAVVVNFTIAADGRVKDAIVEDLIGPSEFGDAAIDSVTGRLYKPATEDGKPVAQHDARLRFMFIVKGEKAARQEVVDEYRHALAFAADGDVKKAIDALNAILARQRLNFYERAMTSDALANFYLKTEDFDDALDRIRDATLSNGDFLEPRLQKDAIRLRLLLEAHAGQLSQAFDLFDYLKSHWKEPVADADTRLIADLHAMMNDPKPIGVPGKIPTSGRTPTWRHVLFRRSFGFNKIGGKLDHFDLRCDQQTIESPITETARWTIPNRWSNCLLFVYGDPAATFQLLEYADAPKASEASSKTN